MYIIYITQSILDQKIRIFLNQKTNCITGVIIFENLKRMKFFLWLLPKKKTYSRLEEMYFSVNKLIKKYLGKFTRIRLFL